MPKDLYWLPLEPNLDEELRALQNGEADWDRLRALAGSRLDFVKQGKLDRAVRKNLNVKSLPGFKGRDVKIAVLASSTVDHLLPAMRVNALARGFCLDLYVPDYGQYRQELLNRSSGLHAYKPDFVLFIIDGPSLVPKASLDASAASVDQALANAVEDTTRYWRIAAEELGAQVIVQGLLPLTLPLFGSYERSVPGSPQTILSRLNHDLEQASAAVGAYWIDVAWWAGRVGMSRWHDVALWHKAKQETSPAMAPLYADLVGRIVSARYGKSRKVLVLDLDNTLWGGVIGDDGLEGVKLGQGSAVGEAHAAFQTYVRDLSRRGVVLTVCSKNEHSVALDAIENHPEMLLRQDDFAMIVANWNDKASNIRHIAETLNVGLDSLVFIDDNPVERDLVRRELPMVATPELPADPAHYAAAVADAGYFEAWAFTNDDLNRTASYKCVVAMNRADETDMDQFLSDLGMELTWSEFQAVDLDRVAQLINKTNQFNLTTRRYSFSDVKNFSKMDNKHTFQFRLSDKHVNYGIISVVILEDDSSNENNVIIDTWLMSCRVFGRGLEKAILNVITAYAKRRGRSTIIGCCIPTEKNMVVQNLYRDLGFEPYQGVEGHWAMSTVADMPGHHIKIRESS